MAEGQDRIGRFEIAAELGRGSMGIVHRAHDPVMGRDVAIKTVLLPHGLTPERKDEFHQRFLREARAAGRLSHPSIVTVYDFHDGADGGSPFIAMEYVEGRTLHELMCQEDARDPGWVLRVGQALADALQVAHEAGVVHRDLKPANILVRESDGAVKISDFGVAHVNRSELTAAGSTYGSPAYMAPERLRGAAADARSDLFALAVILYELLCGRRPFGGDDFASTCAAILNAPPFPIRAQAPTLAPAFDRFFARALAKEPDERYRSGSEMCDALRALEHEQECFQTGEGTQRIAVGREVQQVSPGDRRHVLTGMRIAVVAIPLLLLLIAVTWALRAPSTGDSAPAQEAPAGKGAASTPPPAPVRITPAPAHLELTIASRVKEGTLTLLLDGQKVYGTALQAEPAASNRLLKRLGRREREEITAAIEVPAGEHTVTARLVWAGNARTAEQGLTFDVASGATHRLTIIAGRKVFGPPLTLTFE